MLWGSNVLLYQLTCFFLGPVETPQPSHSPLERAAHHQLPSNESFSGGQLGAEFFLFTGSANAHVSNTIKVTSLSERPRPTAANSPHCG